jgi:hypothetical protein
MKNTKVFFLGKNDRSIMKNLIIGGCTNYGINQLKPWVLSIKETMPDADKVMCVGNASTTTREWLVENGFKLVDMPTMNVPIHVLRFLSIYEYLREHWREYEYVITTDVKDVYFQKNPFVWLRQRLEMSSTKMVAGSEGMLYKDEPWGNDNLMQAYGAYVHELFKNNEIYNVGTIGGKSEYVKDLVFNIFTNAIHRPIPICDQAVYNVLLQTQPYKGCTFFASQLDGWACQSGTTVDPSKIEQFRPFLTEKEPIFVDGLVKTCMGDIFNIVHQYDRVPEWKKFVQEKYGQEDESQFFTYRT